MARITRTATLAAITRTSAGKDQNLLNSRKDTLR
jgi:hypothetical protein